VKAGDFLGAGTVLFGTPSLFSVRATTVLEAFAIPYDVLNGIPVIRWKLLESFARGLEWFSKPNDDGRRLLSWDDEYAVHVQRFDIHHRRLLVNANALVAAIEAQRGREVVQEMFAALIRFAHYHFEQEETLLRLYSYPDLERHREAHQHLLSQAREILDRPAGASAMSAGEAATWLKDWIVPHVVGEDQKYTAHLHARGVY
jgi:hemerythrin